jgi:RNA polymerase sigma-70 factor, ECF subfamily
MQFGNDFIARLRQREEKAFTELYRGMGNILYNYILSRVGGESASAEDILSEVFSDAVDYISSLTSLHSVQAWLYRITKSKVADHYRSKQKEKSWRSRISVDILPAGTESRSDPAQELVSIAERQVVSGAFALLSVKKQEVLRRMYVEEQSVKEIAMTMNCSIKSVESLLFRARKDLEEALARLQKGLGGRDADE